MGQVLGNPIADTVELCHVKHDKNGISSISTIQDGQVPLDYTAYQQNIPRHVAIPTNRSSLDDSFPSRQSDPYNVPIDFDTKSVVSFVAFVPNEPDEEEEEMIQKKRQEYYHTEYYRHREIIPPSQSDSGHSDDQNLIVTKKDELPQDKTISSWFFGLGSSTPKPSEPIKQESVIEQQQQLLPPLPVDESKRVAWDEEVIESSKPQLSQPLERIPVPIRGFDTSSTREVTDEFRRPSITYFDDDTPRVNYTQMMPQDLKAKHSVAGNDGFVSQEPINPSFPSSEYKEPHQITGEQQLVCETRQFYDEPQERRRSDRRRSITQPQRRQSKRRSIKSRRDSMCSAYSVGPRLSTYVALNDDVFQTSYFKEKEAPLAQEHRTVKKIGGAKYENTRSDIGRTKGKGIVSETFSKWFAEEKSNSRPSSCNSSVVDFTVKLKTGAERNVLTGGVMDEPSLHEEYVTFNTPTSRKQNRYSYNSGEHVDNLAFA